MSHRILANELKGAEESHVPLPEVSARSRLDESAHQSFGHGLGPLAPLHQVADVEGLVSVSHHQEDQGDTVLEAHLSKTI